MKKAIFAILMLLAVKTHGENLSLDFGGTTFILPLQVVNATQMYSMDEKRGFTGAETTVLTRGDFDLTLGAATGYGNGVSFPFVGAQIKLPSRFFDTSGNDLKFGAWVGKDYDSNKTLYGLKGSIPLW